MGHELSDSSTLSLPGDKTSEEIRLEEEGCFRKLQVFRYNLYHKDPKVSEASEGDGVLIALLESEEKLRSNCQEEIALRHQIKEKTSPTSRETTKFEKEMAVLSQNNWEEIRIWWFSHGSILGSSGPLKRAFELWRHTTSWYMHSVLVENCKARGGCCGRDCGCCVDSQRASTSAGALGIGHYTRHCECCSKHRGFEFSGNISKGYNFCFEFNQSKDDGTLKNNVYKRRILLASIWGLSVD